MILFVGGDKGFLFIESLIEAVVDVVSAIYTNLIEATPSAKNRVFAVINTEGSIYCRVCIDKYHITMAGLKNITYRNTLNHAYNCIKCGYKITKTNNEIRYEHRHKIGKRGYK